MTQNDKYQKRYSDHQERKKELLNSKPKELPIIETDSFKEIIANRRSVRLFSNKPIITTKLLTILKTAVESPSSCNRQCVSIKIVSENKNKNKLARYLVGGKNWINKADKILLLFADMHGYKSPNEVLYMPYLDAGVMAMTICYSAQAQGIGSCIVNPNIEQEKTNKFNQEFNKNGWRFCTAIALGYPAIQAVRPPKKSLKEFII